MTSSLHNNRNREDFVTAVWKTCQNMDDKRELMDTSPYRPLTRSNSRIACAKSDEEDFKRAQDLSHKAAENSKSRKERWNHFIRQYEINEQKNERRQNQMKATYEPPSFLAETYIVQDNLSSRNAFTHLEDELKKISSDALAKSERSKDACEERKHAVRMNQTRENRTTTIRDILQKQLSRPQSALVCSPPKLQKSCEISKELKSCNYNEKNEEPGAEPARSEENQNCVRKPCRTSRNITV